MGDRWNPTIRTVTTVKPFKFFVPGDGEPVGESPAGRTWTTRLCGDTTGTVKHSYRCPVHGVFDAMVPRSEVPDEVACTAARMMCNGSCGGPMDIECRDGCSDHPSQMECSRPSLWAGSICGIGHASGEVES